MGATHRLGDIIIPAYNEAAVIGRCVTTLRQGLEPDEARIIVAANGCLDDTATIARGLGTDLIVLDIPEASKTAAIRAAEECCEQAPRIYLDADVQLSGTSAKAVFEHLQRGSVAARPRIRYETSSSTWPVRSYYRARSSTPTLMRRLWGAGVYGLSPEGRARFGQYPDAVAEDLWVDQHFNQDEIDIVDESEVVVHAPRTMAGLRLVLRRTYRGAATLEHPNPIDDGGLSTTLRGLAAGARSGVVPAFDACTYATLAATSRADVVLTRTRGWERDDTSRAAP